MDNTIQPDKDGLLYFDGKMFVYDPPISKDGRPETHLLKDLLKLNLASTNLDKEVRPLLRHFGRKRMGFDIPEGMTDSADTEYLEKLGISIRETEDNRRYILPLDKNAIAGNLRFTSSVQETTDLIVGIAAELQFLARLYLYSQERIREWSIFSDIKIDERHEYYCSIVSLPIAFKYELEAKKLNTPVVFDLESITTESKDTFRIIAKVSIYDTFTFDPDGFAFDLSDKAETKRGFAASLLETLLNYMSVMPFTLEMKDDTPALARSKTETWATKLGHAIIDGKITACPHCGNPVYKPRPSSKAFCKQSHQTRYSEKARGQLDKTKDVEAVIRAFPAINPETIRNWPLDNS